MVDEASAGLGCVVMVWRERNIVVTNEEALFICGMEDRQFSCIQRFLLLS
jgi:hypothetical protein